MANSSPANDVPLPSSAGSSSPSGSSDQYYCNLPPNQVVEDAERVQNTPHEVKLDPVQIQDEAPLPQSESHERPTLYKVIDEFDLGTERLPVRDHIAIDNIFCHWPTSVVQNIQAGQRHYVTIRDDTDCNQGGDDGIGGGGGNNRENPPLYLRGLNVYFAKCLRTGHYFLNLSEVFLARQIKVGDIILYEWDPQNGCFTMEVVIVGT